jgi:UDP-glucuronate 4-epimerase
MSTIVVTGGAGFIGSHLCEALLRRGDHVVAIDNLNDFYEPALKRANLALLGRQRGFRFVERDVRDRAAMAAEIDGARPDAIIHLAAMAGVRPSIENPALYADVNVMGTVSLLDAAVAARVPKFLFASSSSVYGNNEKVPFSEDDRVDEPISPYAATKKAGELIAHTYAHLHGMAVSCLRFFTVYGPRQRPEMAILKFARLILAGKPVPMFGDGSMRRDFTYIDDIIDGVVRSLDRARGYRVYNLGESRTVGLSEMIAALEKALGKKAVVQRLPEVPGDVKVTYADVSRARAELGYAPSFPLAEGLRRFAAWLREEGGGR